LAKLPKVEKPGYPVPRKSFGIFRPQELWDFPRRGDGLKKPPPKTPKLIHVLLDMDLEKLDAGLR